MFKGTPNTKGRRAGTPNKTTANVRQLVQKLFEDNLPTLEQDFAQMKPTDRVNAMLKLMQFVLPTLKATEIEHVERPIFKTINLDVTYND